MNVTGEQDMLHDGDNTTGLLYNNSGLLKRFHEAFRAFFICCRKGKVNGGAQPIRGTSEYVPLPLHRCHASQS